MKTLFLSFLFICATGTAHSATQSKLITQKELKAIEEQVDRELLSSNIDNKKKLIANLLAGREFYQYRFFDKSKKYYLSATNIDTSENKTEAYINLMAIALISKDKKELKNSYNEATKYFNNNPNYNSEDIKYYLTSIESYLSGKNTNAVTGFYGQFVKEENLVDLVKAKKYAEALSMLNPEKIGEGDITIEVIIYDSLNVALNKKNVKTLFCEKEFKKYPNAYTYSTLTCGLLSDYLKKSKFDPERLKRAESYFAEMDSEKSYLLEVVKEIK